MTVATQVRLANDIAVQFHHLPPDAAAKAIANHIRQFWEPRMRRELTAHIDTGDVSDLDPLVVDAAHLLRDT